jgi:hypothetical protein
LNRPQTLEVCRIGLLFPFFSLAYIMAPCAGFSLKLRKPFIKFICTSASYFTFLCEQKKTFPCFKKVAGLSVKKTGKSKVGCIYAYRTIKMAIT